jgi:homoserine dehydrogenase
MSVLKIAVAGAGVIGDAQITVLAENPATHTQQALHLLT